MDDIKNIVGKVINDISSKTAGEQQSLEEVFDKVLRKNRISGARISGLKNKNLFVDVDSSARLYQINLIKKKILDEIKEEVGDIEKISFKIGKV